MTFDEVSNPYLEAFGFPDQTFDLEVENKKYVQWYYYKTDIIVEFVCPKFDPENEWEISFEISTDPLKYFKKK